MALVSHVPQLSRVDPGDLARSLLHLFVHVLGTAWAIAAATVPQADEPRLVEAPRERSIEQPQITALERIDPGGRWAKFVRHQANRILKPRLHLEIALTPRVALC